MKCICGHNNKKFEDFGNVSKDCHCYREYTNVKGDLLLYKCSCCNRNYQKSFDEELKKGFANTNRFYNHYFTKFILLMQKVVSQYECMDD